MTVHTYLGPGRAGVTQPMEECSTLTTMGTAETILSLTIELNRAVGRQQNRETLTMSLLALVTHLLRHNSSMSTLSVVVLLRNLGMTTDLHMCKPVQAMKTIGVSTPSTYNQGTCPPKKHQRMIAAFASRLLLHFNKPTQAMRMVLSMETQQLLPPVLRFTITKTRSHRVRLATHHRL